ncbi:MAG: DUF1043 family protein [Pseudomonadota bacterium]
MYESEWVAGIGIAALLVGLLVGIVLGRSSFTGRRAKDLEAELESAQNALTEYRAEVYDQFAETARKFETLNSSYNDLHRHLANSASTLLGDGAGTPLLRGPAEPAEDGSTIEGDAATVESEPDPSADETPSGADADTAADTEAATESGAEAEATAPADETTTAVEEPTAGETESEQTAADETPAETVAETDAATEPVPSPAGDESGTAGDEPTRDAATTTDSDERPKP